jgi:hypothetical protein
LSQQKAAATQSRAGFTGLVHACRDTAAKQLRTLIKDLFNHADATLFDFADKAESNAIQGRFFEAMKEIGDKQSLAHQAFIVEINRGFDRFQQGLPLDETADADSESLTLVEKNDVEEVVTVQSLAAKAHTRHLQAIYALKQRMAIINGGNKLDDRNIPAGPFHILESFRKATRSFTMDVSVKVVLYALFDKHVLGRTEALYEELNSALIKAGILPNLKATVSKRPDSGVAKPAAPDRQTPVSHAPHHAAQSRTAPRHPPEQSGTADNPTSGAADLELFNTIRGLMASRRRASAQAGLGDVKDAGEFDAGGTAGSVSNTPLVEAITVMQTDNRLDAIGAGPAGQRVSNYVVGRDEINALRGKLVDERERIYSGIDRRKVPVADLDVIELVGMLFEYMLNDEAMPNSAKALLSRLHTPFLKVAVLDKAFFNKETHPARRLLNRLEYASHRWVSEDDLERGIFPKMQDVVERIIHGFDKDVGLFHVLLDEFTAEIQHMLQRAEIIETRTMAAAQGQEKLHAARRRARDEIACRVGRRALPGEVTEFLNKTWCDRLLFILLRQKSDAESPDLKHALNLIDRLLWCNDAAGDQSEWRELRAAIPGLQESLHDAMRALGSFGSHNNAELFARLNDYLETLASAPGSVTPPAPATGAVLPVSEDPTGSEDDAAPPPAERAMIERLKEIEFGTWFEFMLNDQGNRQRVKLAWYSQITSNYMFVDSLGAKSIVKPIRELAADLVAGRAHIILDDGKKPFVTRALEAIRSFLLTPIGGSA